MRFILGSFAMLLFSKRLVDEGMNVIRTNSYDVSGYRDVNQNWKLLKGLELANCFQQCIDLADSMCEKANGKAPILHGMCIDSIIGSYCRLKQFDKVEEYRATEDSMRATLLTAQRMADSIVKEAEQKRDQMMTQAEIDAKLKINCLKNEAAAAEERLRKGKEELEKFSAAVRAVCDKEIQLLNELPQAPVELPQEEAKPEDSVQEIEDSVMAAFSEAAPEEDGDTAETQTEASEPVAEAADPAADTSDPFGDFPDLSSTRQINLDELKFGRNYNT